MLRLSRLFSNGLPRVLCMGVLGGMALGTLACGDDEAVTPVPTVSGEELFARGPYAVGMRSMELTYAAAASGDDRTLPVLVWYPAVDGGEAAAPYSVGGIVELDSNGTLDAPAVAADGPFPLCIYSHGSGGEPLLAYPYAELMASHGWVVASVSHIGNTALEVLGGSGDPFGVIALNRPHDITAVLDWIEGGLAADDPLNGQARTDAVLLFGHSFGGSTSYGAAGVDLDIDALAASCTQDCEPYADADIDAAFRAGFGDARIAAIAPQSPGLVPFYASGDLAALTIPTMQMSGRQDLTLLDDVHAQPAWAGLDHPDDIWVEMPTGGHLSFITVCDDLEESLLLSFQPNANEDGCGPDSMPTSEAVPTMAAYLLGFGRVHILGQDAWRPIIAGEPLHPDFVITSR